MKIVTGTIGSLSIGMLLLLGTTPALAADACTYDSGPKIWTCDGEGDGVNDFNGDGRTVNIGATGIINTSPRGIYLDDDTIIQNDGTINVTNQGIEVGDDSYIVNNGSVTAGGDGVFMDEDNTLINNGTIISTGADGVEVDKDGNTIVNNGTIDGDASGIDADGEDDTTVTNNGTIIARGDEGIKAGEWAKITNNGTITAKDKAVELESDSWVVNNGTLTSTDDHGIKLENRSSVTNNGSIFADEVGIKGDDENTIVNNGLIQSTNEEALNLGDDKDFVTNNGRLVALSGNYAATLGGDDDTFTWQANSDIVSSKGIDMEGGDDELTVDAADVIGSTVFESVETIIIAPGSNAIWESTTPDDGILHAGSPTLLGSTGALVGSLSHKLAAGLLSYGGAPDADSTSSDWWVIGGGSTQDDAGQGFSQAAFGLTMGKNIGGMDVFFGYENASADMTSNVQSVDQHMIYTGATMSQQASDSVELVGLALLGATQSTYTLSDGSMTGNGFFGSISGRANMSLQSGFVLGSYAGFSALSTSEVATSSITFSSQTSSSFFGGVDVKTPTMQIVDGMSVNLLAGVGLQTGAANAVTMSAGGSTTTIAGTSSDQQFGIIGANLNMGPMTGSLRLRATQDASLTIDFGIRAEF